MHQTRRRKSTAVIVGLAGGIAFAMAAHAADTRKDEPVVEDEAAARPPAPTVPLARVHEEPLTVTAEDIEWQPGPPSLPEGAEMALLEGDPSAQDRLLTLRLRAPADYHIPAHTHPGDERVTVLSGTVRIGHGENPSREDATELSAGSMFVMPAGHAHALWVEEDTVVQLNSVSPWGIEYVNPADDPRRAASR